MFCWTCPRARCTRCPSAWMRLGRPTPVMLPEIPQRLWAWGSLWSPLLIRVVARSVPALPAPEMSPRYGFSSIYQPWNEISVLNLFVDEDSRPNEWPYPVSFFGGHAGACYTGGKISRLACVYFSYSKISHVAGEPGAHFPSFSFSIK